MAKVDPLSVRSEDLAIQDQQVQTEHRDVAVKDAFKALFLETRPERSE